MNADLGLPEGGKTKASEEENPESINSLRKKIPFCKVGFGVEGAHEHTTAFSTTLNFFGPKSALVLFLKSQYQKITKRPK